MNKMNLYIEKTLTTWTPILIASKNWGSIATIATMTLISLNGTAPTFRDLKLSLVFGAGFAFGAGTYQALIGRCSYSKTLLSSIGVGYISCHAVAKLIDIDQAKDEQLDLMQLCVNGTLIATGLYALNHTINLAKNTLIRA